MMMLHGILPMTKMDMIRSLFHAHFTWDYNVDLERDVAEMLLDFLVSFWWTVSWKHYQVMYFWRLAALLLILSLL